MKSTTNLSSIELTNYVTSQISHFFPIGNEFNADLVSSSIEEAVERTLFCINNVKLWKQNEFDVLHSSQYCTFLWYLSNTIWKRSGDTILPTKIFLLNKALNGFDCFFDNNLPEIFFIGHSVGIVLVRNTYRNYLVLYQGVTVGKSTTDLPVIEEKVILYPQSSVIGKAHINSGSVISKGVNVINQTTPGNATAFQNGKSLVHKPHDQSLFSFYFRFS
jgi:serine O-acetyltransferase